MVLAGEGVVAEAFFFIILKLKSIHSTRTSVGVETYCIGNRSPNGEEVVVRRTLVGGHVSGKTVKCCSGMVLISSLVVPQEVRIHILGYVHRIILLSFIPAQEVVTITIGSGGDFNSFIDVYRIIVSEGIPSAVMPEPGDV